MREKPFVPEQINETLARSLDYKGLLPSSDALAQAIDAGVDQNADADILKFYPIAVWLENTERSRLRTLSTTWPIAFIFMLACAVR